MTAARIVPATGPPQHIPKMAHASTNTAVALLLRLAVICSSVVLLQAKSHPNKLQDIFDVHRNRRDLGELRSWRYTRHAIDVLKADLNNNDLYFCRGDPFRGIQCPEEPFCSAWDQICDGEQICALEHRKECLERSEASFGRMDSRLCDGDENPKWCHWKYQAPVRCGEDIFLKPTQKKIRVQSPRYPDKYPGDFFCYWTVSVPEGHRLSVNFLRFETEFNYDLLSLGTGYNRENTRSVIIFKHSGKKKPEPSQFDVNSNTIWLTFKSDDWENFKGFNIEFTDRERREFGVTAQNPFNQEPNRDCGGKILMDLKGETVIKSPGHPGFYPNNMECEWVVSIEEGLRIRIHFKAFDVEEEEDHLSVGNGVSSRRAPILYKYSSRTKPGDIVSRGSDVWVKFVSSIAVARTGFELVLTEQPINDCGGIFTVPSGGKMSFGSPDYPNNYPGVDDCLWQFRSATDRRIHIGFTEFDTEYTYDKVRIGNGFEPDVDEANVAFEHSGDYLPGGGADSLAFQSSGPVAWVHFTSDNYNQKKGFRFNVYSEEASPWVVEEASDYSVLEPTSDIADNVSYSYQSDVDLPDLQLQDQEVEEVGGEGETGEDPGTQSEGNKKPVDQDPSTDQTEPEPQDPQTDLEGETQTGTDHGEGDPTGEQPLDREIQPHELPRPPKKRGKPKKKPKTEAPTTTEPPTTTTPPPTTKATTTAARTTTVATTTEDYYAGQSSDSYSSNYDSGFSISSSQ